jgi:flagellar motor switch protein FliM
MSSSPKTPPLQRQALDLEELKQQQLNASAGGESEVTMQAGNGDKTYKLPVHEAHLLHVKLIQKVNNPITKKYDEKSTTVQLSAQEFERMEKNETFKQYDEVELLHDPRPKAEIKADKTGDAPVKTPAAAKKPIRSMQDAQMRYKELTKQDAPSDKSFAELKEAIAHFEKELGAQSSTDPAAGDQGTDPANPDGDQGTPPTP